MQRLRTHLQDMTHLLLDCAASEPLRRAIFGTTSSIFDLWSRPWGVSLRSSSTPPSLGRGRVAPPPPKDPSQLPVAVLFSENARILFFYFIYKRKINVQCSIVANAMESVIATSKLCLRGKTDGKTIYLFLCSSLAWNIMLCVCHSISTLNGFICSTFVRLCHHNG